MPSIRDLLYSGIMNNLSLYCGLVDGKIRASDKDLPVKLLCADGPLILSHHLNS